MLEGVGIRLETSLCRPVLRLNWDASDGESAGLVLEAYAWGVGAFIAVHPERRSTVCDMEGG